MRYVVIVLAVVVLIYLIIDFNSRTAELNRLRAEQEVISTRVAVRTQTKAALELQIAFATSDAAVIQWAYENHMARPGDQRVIPLQPAQSTMIATHRPAVTPTVMTNLERWLTLFFDPPTPIAAP